jgi:phospholipid/cholesterol/gamma-HCH transport system substrate-binding protein
MENKSHALTAGFFVLALAALTVALALWLTRDTAVHMSYELSSREAVTGLQTQAGVRFRGVQVGKVVSIGFDPSVRGNVLIRISTIEGVPITKSTFATLGFQGVTGLAFVQLDDTGESSQALVSTEDAPARIPMRPGLLSKLTDQGASILVQLEENSRRVNQLLDANHQKILFAAIEDIGKTAKDVSQSAKGFGQAASSLQQFSANADRVLDFQFGPEKMNLPKLVDDMTAMLKSLQGTSERVGVTADEAKAAATDFRQAAQTLSQPGGALDKLGQGVDTLNQLGQSLSANTLPRLNRTSDETARAVRQVGKSAAALNDNPQALLYGNGAVAPGPGEAGFAAPAGASGARP